MDVGSPDNAFDDINHFLKDDDTTFSDDIDLDFIVDKGIAENCVYSDLSVNGNFHFDLSEQNKQDPPSHSPSFKDYDNLVSPSQNTNSSVQGGFQIDRLSENETIVNPEKLHVQSNENVRNEDSETLCNSYLHDSIFQMDSSPILHEIQNDVSAIPNELVSMEDTNFQDILPKSISPAHNEIGEDSYIEAVQNEPTQSEYACRDSDEEIPVGETENLSFSPGSGSRDPETKSENINESRNSPYGKNEFEPTIIDQESPGRSSEVCKSPNTNGETFSSDIRELPGSPPDYQVIPNSPSLLKQTPSPTECNQEKEPLISVSPLDISPKIFNRMEEEMQQLSGSRNASCFRDETEQCNRPDSRSPPDSQSNHISLESGPSVSHSPKSQEVCSQDDVIKQSELNVSRSRSLRTRECNNRPLEKNSGEQLSQKKRSNVQDSTQVSSYSRPDNYMNESDNNKSNYNRLYSRSACRENYNKRSLHDDSSSGRFSRKVSELQEDHAVSSYSRTSKMKSILVDTYKQKRSRSRSPDTRDFGNKSMRTATLTAESPNRHKLSVTGESLLQPSSSRSCKKIIESPERSNLGKEFCYSDSVRRKHSASPRSTITRQRSTKGVEKRLLPSPRRHYAHHNYHSRGRRSISPEHTRQKGFSSGYKGDVRNRYRSRSPYGRDNGMRSPRRRRSSRHRSPLPCDYSLRSTSRRTHWSPPQDRSTGLGQPGRDLFIAGFNFTTTERDLERKFSRFGRVRDVRIVRDKRSGDSRGFGFLTLERDEQADAAIRALDKTEWGGRIVLVEKTKSH